MANHPVVVDNGSVTFKAGFAGHDAPRIEYPSVVGRHRNHLRAMREWFVGNRALRNRDIFTLKYPLERGIVTNWYEMEMLWHHAFYVGLTIPPEDHYFLFTEVPSMPKKNREQMAQVVFEDFDIPAMYVANEAVLSLYSSGRIDGLVVESGESATHAVPVSNGWLLSSAVSSANLGGCDMTECFAEALKESGHPFLANSDRDILRKAKEQLIYVAQDFEHELELVSARSDLEKSYEMPDGKVITLNEERFRCAEALFQPSLFGMGSCGIQHTIHESIMLCDSYIRDKMYGNLVLSGGNSMLPGIGDRLCKELATSDSHSKGINLIAPKGRNYSAWRGGSILASQSTFPQMCVSREEYWEFGPPAVHRKCFYI